jgi:hypothetical protein
MFGPFRVLVPRSDGLGQITRVSHRWARGRPLRFLFAASLALGTHILLLRPRLFRWGASDEEVARLLPGDDEVPGAQIHGTRAVTIEAGPREVWPWIAQIGYLRAGWYAFDFADNDNIPSATRLIPELQHPTVGQTIGEEGYTIIDIDPPQRMVLAFHHRRVEWILKGGLWPRFGDSSWTFVLQPVDGGRGTRLIARLHYRVPLGLHVLWWPLFEVVDYILQPLMLRRIKQRVETSARKLAGEDAPLNSGTFSTAISVGAEVVPEPAR